MEVRHGGLEQLTVTSARASSFSTAQQHDYLASVWLSKKEKLEHSQQKCIVIFALVCCFAVLVALIFSAVDVLGEDEDGITEENCSRNCTEVLVENIPEDISMSHEGTIPLFRGLLNLLDRAQRSVEIVSPLWDLNSTNHNIRFAHANQGQILLQRLMGLKAKGVQLKVASRILNSSDPDDSSNAELRLLTKYGAEVHELNMSALTKGQLHSSFWVVDRKHMYIGSASMDWRSLSMRKELGIIIHDCSCLVLDLNKIFNLYWQLQYRDFVPAIWSKKLNALYTNDRTLDFHLNHVNAKAYFSTSPDVFRPKDRTRDIDAIFNVIRGAERFIYISITDYLPLIFYTSPKRYWSRIDDMLREALILKHVKVRLLISCREQTHNETYSIAWSLKSLCMEISSCSVEVRFFSPRQQEDGSLQGINHQKYMLTDNSVYLGNLDWVGNEFIYNAGAGLVINSSSLVEQVKSIFERDWHSAYSKTLQPNKIPTCSTNTFFPSPLLKGQTGHTEHGGGPNNSL